MRTIATLIAALLLAGCTIVPKSEPSTLYDLGPLRTERPGPSLPALPPISIAEIQVPAWLDSTMIFFRLNYANSLQPRPYAQARWSMTPSQLLAQHLKSRIVQAGGVVLNASDGGANVPVLRIETDEFTQNFDAPASSSGQVGLRASVFKGCALIAKKTFVRQAPAPSADASGGASALAAASDAAIADLIAWLGALPLR
jgi:cholesterol transport system auxiliary component